MTVPCDSLTFVEIYFIPMSALPAYMFVRPCMYGT